MGGLHSISCNHIARDIWQWAAGRGIWLTIAHFPGPQNVAADYESRHFHPDTKWQLKPSVFAHVITHFGVPVEVDLMASRTNHQLPIYMSWWPDPQAVHVDAFTTDRHYLNLWCFPPFSPSLIAKVLQKLHQDNATGLVVLPNWATQPWFPTAMNSLAVHLRVLPKHQCELQLPEIIDPLQGRLELLICLLSGMPCKVKDYQNSLLQSSYLPGGTALDSNTAPTSNSGRHIVLNGKVIPLN